MEKQTKVLVFMGMVASGKSYLASAIHNRIGCPYYNSDTLRKELAGLDPENRQWQPIDAGIYSPEMSRRTYDALIASAQVHIKHHEALVLLDGSYGKRDERRRIREGLGDICALRFVYCYCSEEISLKRMASRAEDSHAISDGRPLIYEHQLKTYELPEELDAGQVILLDTNQPVDRLIDLVL